MKMEQAECSERLAYQIQTPRNYPEESMQFRFFRVFPISFDFATLSDDLSLKLTACFVHEA